MTDIPAGSATQPSTPGTAPARVPVLGQTASPAQAMAAARAAADAAVGTTRPNPAVGAVILDAEGRIAGTGATAPAGGPHAEVRALSQAGEAARGGTAVVTLEPCRHTGRTGPCTAALIAAGIAEVHYAVADPGSDSGGGARELAAAGIRVHAGLSETEAAAGALAPWLHRMRTGRPRITVKIATTLDGRIAAADGTSRWITGPEARERVHRERARIDAIVVGTGTALADDPALTARLPGGALAATQPLRVVVGLRDLPAGARLHSAEAPTRHLRTRDPAEVVAALAADCAEVQIEGGAQLIGAFFAAGLVDRVQLYQAPVVLGAGPAAVGAAGAGTIAAAHRLTRVAVEPLGADLLTTFVTGQDGARDGDRE